MANQELQAIENDIKQEDIKAFEKIVNQLDELMKRICSYCPDANLFINEGDNFALMSGNSWDENKSSGPSRMRQDRIVIALKVYRSSGGTW